MHCHCAVEAMKVVYGLSVSVCPPQGDCKSVLEALATANNVHKGEDKAHKVGCDERASVGQRGRHLDALAQF